MTHGSEDQPRDQTEVAVVTGAASGIGRAAASRLSGLGMAVCLVDLAPLDDVVDQLRAHGAAATSVRGDVGDLDTMRSAFDAAGALGRPSTAVLNAGVFTGESDITKVSPVRYQQVIRANIDGVVNGLRAFLEKLAGGPGRAVVTASSAGLLPAPHDPIYVMTKHAVIGLIRSLALQPHLDNTPINCICPNGVDTPMLTEELKRGRQLLTPDDVAARILEILASEGTGEAYVCTPTLFTRYEFPPNPGYTFPSFESAGTVVPAKKAPM